MEFNKKQFALALCAALDESDELTWKDIMFMAKLMGFPDDGNWLEVRGVVQTCVDGELIKRIRDVHTERYTLV